MWNQEEQKSYLLTLRETNYCTKRIKESRLKFMFWACAEKECYPTINIQNKIHTSLG